MAKFGNQMVEFLIEKTFWNLTRPLQFLKDWKSRNSFPPYSMVIKSTKGTEQQTNQGTNSYQEKQQTKQSIGEIICKQ